MNSKRKNRIFRNSVNGLIYFITAIIASFETGLIEDAFNQTHNINLLKIYGVFILISLIIPLIRDKWRGNPLRWRTAGICLHVMIYLACAAAFTNNFLFLWPLWTVGLIVIILQSLREDLIPLPAPAMQRLAKPIKLLNWLALIMLLTFCSCALITANGLFWWPVAIIVAPYFLIGCYAMLREIRNKRRAKKASQEKTAAPQTL